MLVALSLNKPVAKTTPIHLKPSGIYSPFKCESPITKIIYLPSSSKSARFFTTLFSFFRNIGMDRAFVAGLELVVGWLGLGVSWGFVWEFVFGLQIWGGPRTVLIGVWLGSRLCACWRFLLCFGVGWRLRFLDISLSFLVWASFHLLLVSILVGEIFKMPQIIFCKDRRALFSSYKFLRAVSLAV